MYMRSTVQSNWLENLYVCDRGQSSKDCISAEQVHVRNFSKKLEDILDWQNLKVKVERGGVKALQHSSALPV